MSPLAAVSNAVRDQLGFRIPDLPLSPPRVLEAIDKQGGATEPSPRPPTSRGSAATALAFAVGSPEGTPTLIVFRHSPGFTGDYGSWTTIRP